MIDRELLNIMAPTDFLVFTGGMFSILFTCGYYVVSRRWLFKSFTNRRSKTVIALSFLFSVVTVLVLFAALLYFSQGWKICC